MVLDIFSNPLRGRSKAVFFCCQHFHDLPPFGAIRILTATGNNAIFNYTRKFVYPTIVGEDADSFDSIVLTADPDSNLPFQGVAGSVVELLHQEYSSPVVRVQFHYDPLTGLIQTQFKVGVLDMSLPYEEDLTDDIDDYVRGMAPGYAVSSVYSQAGTFSGIGIRPSVQPEGFVVYDGGVVLSGDVPEYWNRLEVMLRDNQIWIWWNRLLIPPNSSLSSALPTPVTITTPYFPIALDSMRPCGKVGFRLWPGATLRRMDLRTQMTLFNEFVYGQLSVL